MKISLFVQSKLQGPPARSSPRCVGPNGCAAERSAVLDFLVLFGQAKRTLRGRRPDHIKYFVKEVFLLANLWLLLLRSFVLIQKNQKIKHFGSPPGEMQPCAPGWLPFWSSSFWCLQSSQSWSKKFFQINNLLE